MLGNVYLLFFFFATTNKMIYDLFEICIKASKIMRVTRLITNESTD